MLAYYSGGKEEVDPGAIEEEILREQLRLRRLKLKNTDQYKMLDILKCMYVGKLSV